MDPAMPIKRKRVLITGATGAIGEAVARTLASPGSALTLCYRSAKERAEGLAAKLGDICRVHLAQADLALSGAPAALIERSVNLMGGLDLLVHCAAIFERTPLGTVTEDRWTRIIDTNLRSSFFLAQAAAMHMQGEGGSIILLSDVAARKPYGDYLPYCIAKAGIDSLVRGIARQVAPKITANAVAPYVVTRPEGISDKDWKDMLDKTPMRRASTPEEIAEVVGMIAGSETMTGQVISVDGGRMLR